MWLRRLHSRRALAREALLRRRTRIVIAMKLLETAYRRADYRRMMRHVSPLSSELAMDLSFDSHSRYEESVLSFGCGYGLELYYWSRLAHSVVGAE